MSGHCEDCCCARSWKALGISEYTGTSIPEEIERLQARVKELEEELSFPLRELAVRRQGHIITDDQINAAVEFANRELAGSYRDAWLTLNKFNIHRCEGCVELVGAVVSNCPDCNGRGWAKP